MTNVSQTWSYFIIPAAFALLLTLSIFGFVYAAEEYLLIKEWGSQGTDNGQFHLPYSIAIDSITEGNAGRILKFTNDGNLITNWDAPSAIDIALDSLGKAYIASGTNHIQIYSKDSTRPTVITTSPINGAKDVSLIKPITVTFSREMDSSTITPNTFTIEDSSNKPVAGTVSTSGNIAAFTPTSKLDYTTTYTGKVRM